MKIIIVTLLFVFLSFNSFSQHNYENPREKSKRGLLEEPLEEKNIVEESSVEKLTDNSPKISKKERKFCACEKTYFLSLKRYKLQRKLVNDGVMNSDGHLASKFYNHKVKAEKAMKMIRAKYEIDEEFECSHSSLSFKKLSKYKNEIAGLVDQCDIDIITE